MNISKAHLVSSETSMLYEVIMRRTGSSDGSREGFLPSEMKNGCLPCFHYHAEPSYIKSAFWEPCLTHHDGRSHTHALIVPVVIYLLLIAGL